MSCDCAPLFPALVASSRLNLEMAYGSLSATTLISHLHHTFKSNNNSIGLTLPTMPRASPRKRRVVNYNEDQDDVKPVKNGAAKAVAKVKEVVSEEIEEVKKVVSKVTGKRKAAPESGAADPIILPKTVKKRKTKAKEEDSMPLAERTAVSALKNAMYIGAHVSGAGGLTYFLKQKLFSRC